MTSVEDASLKRKFIRKKSSPVPPINSNLTITLAGDQNQLSPSKKSILGRKRSLSVQSPTSPSSKFSGRMMASRKSIDGDKVNNSMKKDYSLPEITSIKSKLDSNINNTNHSKHSKHPHHFHQNSTSENSRSDIGHIETPISPNQIQLHTTKSNVESTNESKNDSKFESKSDMRTVSRATSKPESHESGRNSKNEESKDYGLFSTIISAAHNAANNMMNSVPADHSSTSLSNETDHSKHDLTEHGKSLFSKRLDYLLSNAAGKSKTKSIEEQAQELENNTELNNLITSTNNQPHNQIPTESIMQSQQDLNMMLRGPNVQFHPVKESPLNTLGSGNLSLNALGFGSSSEDIPLKNGNNLSRPKLSILSPQHSNKGSSENLVSYATPIQFPAPSSSQQHEQKLQALSVPLDPPTPQRRGASPSVVSRFSNTRLSELAKKPVSRRSGSLTSRDPGNSNIHINSRRSGSLSRDGLRNSITERDKSLDLGDSDSSSKGEENGVASEKRNNEFHQIFRTISSEERLIEDYSCAYSKDILIQGRMYLSDSHICFNSNILGWVTNLTIPLKEVVQMEKKSTAVLFPNGMIIRTLHSRYVFATFLQRDSAFDSITKTWNKVIAGSKNITLNSNGKKRKRLSGSQILANDDSFSDDEDDDSYNSDRVTLPSDDGDNDNGESDDEDMIRDDVNDESPGENTEKESHDVDDFGASKNVEATNDIDNPFGKLLSGPSAHAPTEHGYTKSANETLILDDVIQAPLSVVFNLLFGEDESYMRQILTKQKNFDINDLSGLASSQKERKYSYIKPLGGPIGPKQTRCLITDTIESVDFTDKCIITQSSNTPDVPSGNAFTVVTKIILHWGPANNTGIYVATAVNWTGKSWIKSAVEKGTVDGQKESMKILVAEANNIIKSKFSGSPSAGAGSSKKKKKRKSTLSRGERKQSSSEVVRQVEIAPPKNEWVDSVSRILDLVPLPFDNFFKLPLLLVMFFVIFTFCRGGHKKNKNVPTIGRYEVNGLQYTLIPSINDLASHDELKSQSEVEIWDWIMDRSGGGANESQWEFLSTKKESKTVKGYKRQEAKEKIRLMQERIDEITRLLD